MARGRIGGLSAATLTGAALVAGAASAVVEREQDRQKALPARPGGDTPPDRLSLDERSPFYDLPLLARGVGIMFKGAERFNVYEYCVSERWVRLIPPTQANKKRPVCVKLQGDVRPFFRDIGP